MKRYIYSDFFAKILFFNFERNEVELKFSRSLQLWKMMKMKKLMRYQNLVTFTRGYIRIGC